MAKFVNVQSNGYFSIKNIDKFFKSILPVGKFFAVTENHLMKMLIDVLVEISIGFASIRKCLLY